MNTYQILDAFKAAMSEAGVTPPVNEIIADGKWHRYHIAGHKAGSKNGAYLLHTDGKPNGLFEDHKALVSGKWKAGGDTKPLAQADRLQCEATAKQNEQQIAQRYEQAALKAKHLLDIAKPLTGNHPYLQRKRIEAHGLYRLQCWTKRQKNEAGQWVDINIHNVLLVPITDLYGKLWNLQAIFPERHPLLGRDKDFLSGGRLGGLFHVIGSATEEILIAEGYGTGATLHTATGLMVLCALSANNLLKVANSIRAIEPSRKITICADNDEKTPGNPGLSAAKKAALAVGGYLAVPPVPGDFNDYANREVQL